MTVHLRGHHLSADFEAFHAMVTADILVMGKSTFPYEAGFLSEGIKIYLRHPEEFIKPPEDGHWIASDHAGHFDTTQLKKRFGKSK